MTTKVSRLTSAGQLVVDGKPACVVCGRRPQRWSGGRWQSYCTVCHAEDHRNRRAADQKAGRTVTVKLTPGEAELIRALRAEPAGRHHARSAG